MSLFEINTVTQIAVLLLFLVVLVLAVRFSNKKLTKRIAELRDRLQKLEGAVKKNEEKNAAANQNIRKSVKEIGELIKNRASAK